AQRDIELKATSQTDTCEAAGTGACAGPCAAPRQGQVTLRGGLLSTRLRKRCRISSRKYRSGAESGPRQIDQEGSAIGFLLDAFSSRKPIPTSLEKPP